ncbi:MAG: hypothetical protein AAF651_00845 [Cyanobacteria bacterium P01_C01_bin.73]
MLAPIIAFVGFRWWLQRSLIQADCPVCGTRLASLKGVQTPCVNCGTVLLTTDVGFQRSTPDGTIDVDAVEVEVESVEQLPKSSTEQ